MNRFKAPEETIDLLVRKAMLYLASLVTGERMTPTQLEEVKAKTLPRSDGEETNAKEVAQAMQILAWEQKCRHDIAKVKALHEYGRKTPAELVVALEELNSNLDAATAFQRQSRLAPLQHTIMELQKDGARHPISVANELRKASTDPDDRARLVAYIKNVWTFATTFDPAVATFQKEIVLALLDAHKGFPDKLRDMSSGFDLEKMRERKIGQPRHIGVGMALQRLGKCKRDRGEREPLPLEELEAEAHQELENPVVKTRSLLDETFPDLSRYRPNMSKGGYMMSSMDGEVKKEIVVEPKEIAPSTPPGFIARAYLAGIGKIRVTAKHSKRRMDKVTRKYSKAGWKVTIEGRSGPGSVEGNALDSEGMRELMTVLRGKDVSKFAVCGSAGKLSLVMKDGLPIQKGSDVREMIATSLR